MYRIEKSVNTESRLFVVRGWEEYKKWGVTANGYKVSISGNEILWNFVLVKLVECREYSKTTYILNKCYAFEKYVIIR